MKNLRTQLINREPRDKPDKAPAVQAINPPAHHASTVLFESCTDLQAANRGAYPGARHGTAGRPVQRTFEDAMAALEGSGCTRAFQSGINAITTALMALAKSGDHILALDSVYGPTRRFGDQALARFGVRTDYPPPAGGADEPAHIRPENRLDRAGEASHA